jgi:hypothetical protein
MVVATTGGTAVAAAPAISARFDPISAHGGALRFDEESNWAGYIATKTTFSSASASWTIPSATCINDEDLYAPWVGIDGGSASSQTVEQTGVATSCSSGSPTFEAWYEMYPAAPHYYSNPVAVGDVFNASVVASGKKFTLTITDTTQGWTQKVTKSLSSAKKITAEAVIEAPGGFPKIAGVNFSSVEFNGSALDNFHLTATESNGEQGGTTYAPGAISNGDDFAVLPQS